MFHIHRYDPRCKVIIWRPATIPKWSAAVRYLPAMGTRPHNDQTGKAGGWCFVASWSGDGVRSLEWIIEAVRVQLQTLLADLDANGPFDSPPLLFDLAELSA